MREQFDFSKGTRGPVVRVAKGKTRITIRIDDDLLEWFRQQVHAAGGGNYQTLLNDALRAYIDGQREPLESVARRVVKQELRRALPAKRRGAKAAERTTPLKPGRR